MSVDYKLNNICDVSSSKRIFMSEYTETGIPFYRSKEIIELSSGKTISTPLFISIEKYKEIKGKFGAPTNGDILMTSVGTLGETYYVKNSNFYFKDGNLIWLHNFNPCINSKYLYYLTKSDFFKEAIKANSIGSTQKALTIDSVKHLNVPVPSKEEQQHIVDTSMNPRQTYENKGY